MYVSMYVLTRMIKNLKIQKERIETTKSKGTRNKILGQEHILA